MQTNSLTSSLFIAQRSSTYSQGNIEKCWGEKIFVEHLHLVALMIESTESHMILGGSVAVCLLLSAHHTVIFATA